ncbi:hypothetical protein PoB_002669100 [Plakobranchus ocellatus]|uniref:Uncharacterized protein n=1 Tax=Plakobranchus ocellatus TaxID=259542 RepID=A0AAV3ZW93_9GAST|nr:hypothetical protein PoB_002669100 [Plakobranchus ocellatus]
MSETQAAPLRPSSKSPTVGRLIRKGTKQFLVYFFVCREAAAKKRAQSAAQLLWEGDGSIKSRDANILLFLLRNAFSRDSTIV